MDNNLIMFPLLEAEQYTQITEITTTDYDFAELQFMQLLQMENLDEKINSDSTIAAEFEWALTIAIPAAYQKGAGDEAAHRFLQRILYRINRLKLFWYEDLHQYTNERSNYLRMVRDHIQEVWQQWELMKIDMHSLQQIDVEEAKTSLIERANADFDPPFSMEGYYIREEMSEVGYRRLLAIASFDSLVERSRFGQILGGAANQVQSTLVNILLEEYSNGRLSHKSSAFLAQMLSEFGMRAEPEGYFDFVPWEVIACANHNFFLTEQQRYFLRYSGGLTYFQVGGCEAYRDYLAAAERLGLSSAAINYWQLQVKTDEHHGRWMLDEVALPLVDRYPADAWELLLGYDQQKLMCDRANSAIFNSIRQVEEAALARMN
jgi:hypothetical protein